MLARLRKIGPGALVAAAFIGPGTVTTCMLAGSGYGYALLWALLLATLMTMFLQNMAARLGVVTGKGLGAVLRESLERSPLRLPFFGLILAAIYMGNCAYEAGNLSGAALGVQSIFGQDTFVFRIGILSISALAALILWTAKYRVIERVLIGLVLVMAASFTMTFFVVDTDWSALLRGLLVPKVPGGALLLVIALIGTTVVPYNLFLHAGAVKDRWPDARQNPKALEDAIKSARLDSAVSIGFGGLIAILIASSTAGFVMSSGLPIESAADMSAQFQGVYGGFAKYMLGLGLLAAGLSSAITAPLATGYAVTEVLGRSAPNTTQTRLFRMIALSVLVCGAGVALTGIKPLKIIVSAQFANGLLLPIAASFLLFAMNRKAILGAHVNGRLSNIVGIVTVLFVTGLGLRHILKAFGVI